MNIHPPPPKLGPVVITMLSENGVLEVNEQTKLEAASSAYFILRNESTGELLVSYEEKDKTKFPISWGEETYHSAVKDKLQGTWILIKGDDVTVRIIGSSHLLVGPKGESGAPFPVMFVFFMMIFLLWLWFAMLLTMM